MPNNLPQAEIIQQLAVRGGWKLVISDTREVAISATQIT